MNDIKLSYYPEHEFITLIATNGEFFQVDDEDNDRIQAFCWRVITKHQGKILHEKALRGKNGRIYNSLTFKFEDGSRLLVNSELATGRTWVEAYE